MWNLEQTSSSIMFYKYIWLQLWFSMPNHHKRWEHHMHQNKNTRYKQPQSNPIRACQVHIYGYDHLWDEIVYVSPFNRIFIENINCKIYLLISQEKSTVGISCLDVYIDTKCSLFMIWFLPSSLHTLREESCQTNVILQYKLLATILSAVCSVIQQS